MYDVVVVGAGPAGSAAAKRCAESGLRTLMLDKHKLPRDKVCSGMVMGPLAQALIQREFGALPERVLTEPRRLSGYCFHVPGIGSEKLEHITPLTWRRRLDYWMNQRAQECGVEIWQRARVTGLYQKGKGFSVRVERNKRRQEIEAAFLVGADGATSVVRRSLFPELKVRYGQIYQQHYPGALDLDKNYMHWFYPLELSPASFTAHQKDGLVIVDVSGRPGMTNQLMAFARKCLAENYHFEIGRDSLWRGSCLEPVLYRELTSHAFRPAKGNAFLVGDAAGLIMPVSGEGLGVGIKSALSAASSIIGAGEGGGSPEEIYLAQLAGTISLFGEIYPWFRKILEAAKGDERALPKVLREAYEKTLRMF